MPLAIYSLRISFCIVPLSSCGVTPCFLATAIYRASRTEAVAFIVIDVLTLSNGILSNRISISARLDIGTPVRPTSPVAIG